MANNEQNSTVQKSLVELEEELYAKQEEANESDFCSIKTVLKLTGDDMKILKRMKDLCNALGWNLAEKCKKQMFVAFRGLVDELNDQYGGN